MASEKIQIKNDKGRLSQEDIERMLADAEKYQKEDEMQKSKVEKRNELENTLYSLKPMVEKMQDGDQKTQALDYISNTLAWVDNNFHATQEEYEEKLKELQEKAAEAGTHCEIKGTYVTTNHQTSIRSALKLDSFKIDILYNRSVDLPKIKNKE